MTGDEPTIPSLGDGEDADSASDDLATEVSERADEPESGARIASAEPTVGDVLNNRFVLEKVIGRGGMGVVYMARDLRMEEARDREPYVAIKALNSRLSNDPEGFIALQRESRKAQRLAHPNIATVYDFDRDAQTGTVYMTMELLKGEPLEDLIKRMSPNTLPFDEAWSLITQMAQGLAYAHDRGIVHSDYKPANAFVLSSGEVKLLDFGISRAVKPPGQSQGDLTNFVPKWEALTPAYASCEMFSSAPPDPRDDVYALACVAYELLGGEHPFARIQANFARERGMEVQPINSLSKQQNAALAAGLAFERKERLESVNEFLDAMEGGDAVRGRRLPLIAGALTVLVAGAGIAFFMLNDTGTEVNGTMQPEAEVAAPVPVPASTPARILDAETLERVSRILEIADLHLAVGRLVEPPGSNATEAYQAVLEMQPTNARAREGLAQALDGLLKNITKSMEQGQIRNARISVEAGLKYFPNNSDLQKLAREIGADITAGDA